MLQNQEIIDLDFTETLNKQRSFFESHQTRSLAFRKESLQRLKRVLKNFTPQILQALKEDMRKPALESYMGEIAFVTEEIEFALKNLDNWAKASLVPSPLVWWPAQSRIEKEPLGVVLILSAWNYPVQLLLGPLVAALAAGNTAVLKPAEFAAKTSQVLSRLIRENFPCEYIAVVEGAIPETEALLKLNFDHIFFTGSTAVGKIVMRAAAENLTPVTLELGGKSPCIVDEKIDLKIAAQRIVWGKFYNAGQTCVAPDYLMVHEKIYQDFLSEMEKVIVRFYGENPEKSEDYARIVNLKHFDRLQTLLENTSGRVRMGGTTDRSSLYIAPTLVTDLPESDSLMKDEIFGPLLPIFKWRTLKDVQNLVNQHSHPLAFYVFTENRQLEKTLTTQFSFGGATVNDTLIHLTNPHLPFGGIRTSGIGRYHGKDGFETFSHSKAILRRPLRFWDPSLRYPPYRGKLKWMKWLQFLTS